MVPAEACEVLLLFSDLTGNTLFGLEPGRWWSTIQSRFVFPKTSRLTWHHGCSMVEGFVMTSFKTTVVHGAKFSIVLRGQEHAKILTNKLYWAESTWQSLSDCDLKGKTLQKYMAMVPAGEFFLFNTILQLSCLHPRFTPRSPQWNQSKR